MKGFLCFMLTSILTISGVLSDEKAPSSNEYDCPKVPTVQGGMFWIPSFPAAGGVKGEKGDRGPAGEQGPPGESGSFTPTVTYTRWGSTSCRDNLVYSGRVGGTHHRQGGGANFLCLPNDPEYVLPYRAGVQGWSYIYGTEYEFPVVSGRNDQNIPCAICTASNKTTSLMIPAKASCPRDWTREYYGYLMSGYRGRDRRSNYVCVDRSFGIVPGLGANQNEAVLYHVEATCSGLSCGPYNTEKELNCVVCTM